MEQLHTEARPLTVNIVIGNGNIIGDNNLILGASSPAALALIDIFSRLDTVQQARLLAFADKLNKEAITETNTKIQQKGR